MDPQPADTPLSGSPEALGEACRRAGSPRSGGSARGLVPYTNKSDENGPFHREITILKRTMRAGRMAAGVRIRARLHDEAMQRGGHRTEAVMITPTYAPGNRWRPKHMSSFVDTIRKHLRRRGVPFRYVWVAELQEGRMERLGASSEEAVHYHLILWLPKDVRLPKPDNAGWWTHGITRIEKAKHGAAYITKYASKAMGVHEFPRYLRLSGGGGLEVADRLMATWCLLPSYARGASEPGERMDRRPGGGFINTITGECVRSPWELVERRDGWLRFVYRGEGQVPPPLPSEVRVSSG